MTSIIQYPDRILKMKCEIVTPNEDNAELIDEMFETMKDIQGLGLAANQLGISKQIFVMHRMVVINPQILRRSQEHIVMIEGCLSFVGRKVRTRRSKEIDVAFYDRDFNEVTKTLYDLDAVIFQHEHDHMRGKTMLDREFNGRHL